MVESSQAKAAMDTNSTAPVVVVGGGVAGLCAAIAAAEHDSSVSVRVLDSGHGGGTSAISGGVIYAGGGTREQAEAGYGSDTPGNMAAYLRREVGDAVDEATLQRFCHSSAAQIEWLRGHGVAFAGTLCPFRTSYPRDGHHLFFSGNEWAHPFVDGAEPVPRGHRVVGKGYTGQRLWEALFAAARRLGVRFEMASKVETLLFDAEGRVNGVAYRAFALEDGGGVRGRGRGLARHLHRALTRLAAHLRQVSMHSAAAWIERRAHAIWDCHAVSKTLRGRAVILAAGGFVMNASMMQQYVPWASRCRVAPLGTAGDDGSGIQLGMSAGGVVSHMDRLSIWRLIYPPEALLEGVVVSAGGERVAAEDLYGASFSHVLASRFDGRAFLLLDALQWHTVKNQIRQQTQMPWTLLVCYLVHWHHKKAHSIAALAAKLGVAPSPAVSTVRAYNEAIIDGKEDPVGKVRHRSVIAQAPYYGIDISFQSSGLLVAPALPLGGLQVDDKSGEVLDESGGKIQGLYAAGKNAAGISSHSYVSGLALADCVFSGMRAGQHAANRPLDAKVPDRR